MKILFAIHQFFPKYYTGTERSVLNIVKQLMKTGHFVQVITYGDDDLNALDPDKERDGISVQEYTYEGVPVTGVRDNSLTGNITFGISEGLLKPFLSGFVRRGGFDVIHIAHPCKMGILARVGKNLRIPVIATLHDFWLLCLRVQLLKPDSALCSGPKNGIECIKDCCKGFSQGVMAERLMKTKEFFDLCNVITSPSRFLIDMFHLNGWVREIQHVRCGIDYSSVGARLKRRYTVGSKLKISYLGTILYHKGIHVLIKAIRKIKSNKITFDISLDIWGGYFHERDYYKRLTRLVRGDKRINFKGEYDYASVFKILKESDLIVVPSLWWENSPFTILTGFAAGIPAIVSNIGGMAELVKDGKTGFTFEVGNPESLAQVIERIMNDPTIINDLKRNISAPRIEEEAFEYEKIYHKLNHGVKS